MLHCAMNATVKFSWNRERNPYLYSIVSCKVEIYRCSFYSIGIENCITSLTKFTKGLVTMLYTWFLSVFDSQVLKIMTAENF